MHSNFYDAPSHDQIHVTDEVLEYINKRKCDFRICTSCGGPILLPITMKPPKANDFQVRAGDYTILHFGPPGTLSPFDRHGDGPFFL